MEKKPAVIIVDELRMMPKALETMLPLLALSKAAVEPNLHSYGNIPEQSRAERRDAAWNGNNSFRMKQSKKRRIRLIAKHSRQYNRRKQRGMRVSSRRI